MSTENCKHLLICHHTTRDCLSMKVNKKYSSAVRSKYHTPSTVKRMLRVLREDVHTLQTKIASLQSSTVRGMTSYQGMMDKVYTVELMHNARFYKEQIHSSP